MLFVPAGANAFSAIDTNAAGRPAGGQGTTVTPAVGSKGSWVEIASSLSRDTYGLMINFNSNAASAASRNTVVDVGIGAAGSEVVIIPNLIAGNAGTYGVGSGGLWYYFPMAIPAGSRLALRAQGTVTSAFGAYLQAFQAPLQPAMMKKASSVEALGMTVPQGTAVTAGTTSDGSWTLLGTTTRQCWFWQVGVQVQSSDTAHIAGVYHIDIATGDGTNFNTFLTAVYFSTTTGEQGNTLPTTVGCELPVPAGTDIYARAQCSGTPDPIYITAYGARV
jgi:hypothetical protein